MTLVEGLYFVTSTSSGAPRIFGAIDSLSELPAGQCYELWASPQTVRVVIERVTSKSRYIRAVAGGVILDPPQGSEVLLPMAMPLLIAIRFGLSSLQGTTMYIFFSKFGRVCLGEGRTWPTGALVDVSFFVRGKRLADRKQEFFGASKLVIFPISLVAQPQTNLTLPPTTIDGYLLKEVRGSFTADSQTRILHRRQYVSTSTSEVSEIPQQARPRDSARSVPYLLQVNMHL